MTKAELELALKREQAARKRAEARAKREATARKRADAAREKSVIAQLRAEAERDALRVEAQQGSDRQTATSKILGVISSSPTDVQPVFDAIAQSAADLCAADWSGVSRFDGELVHLNAVCGFTDEAVEVMRRDVFPYRPVEGATGISRALGERRPVHIEDVRADPAWRFPVMKSIPEFRTFLAVPMLREGQPIGAITVGRSQARPFSDAQIELLQTFADQAVIAIENVRLFRELQDKNRALTEAHAQVTEALEQQTATAEILRVISSSPTNFQPVFDAVVQSAQRLLRAYSAGVLLRIGDMVDVAGYTSTDHAGDAELRSQFPMPMQRQLMAHPLAERVWADGQTLEEPDIEGDLRLPETTRRLARARGFRSRLAVPLCREGAVIGVLAVTRREPGRFSESEIALLRTFADQAVIAVENVRLFTELQEKNRAVTEALEQQTATAEILRVISSSPTDVRPVFDAIATSARRLCGGLGGAVFTYDGRLVHLAAVSNVDAKGVDALRQAYPIPADRASASSRAILDRSVVTIPDVFDAPGYEHGDVARAGGFRSVVSVPMLREGTPIGCITVTKERAGAFTDAQIHLLKTFADQAVIAIENVRLFTELEQKNSALTEALQQQTATGEILSVISSSPTDAQPVFDAIARNAARLCEAEAAAVLRLEGEVLNSVSWYNTTAGFKMPDAVRVLFPIPASAGASGRAIMTGSVVHIPDVFEDSDYELRALATTARYRGILSAPMLHEGRAIGVINLVRSRPGPFAPEQIHLLQTFSAQAVIAMENVRLFTELQEKNRALTEALEQQTATSEILRVISSSPISVQPVFDAVASSALRLLEGYTTSVVRIVGDTLHLAGFRSIEPRGDAAVRSAYPMPVSAVSVAVEMLRERRPILLTDVQNEREPFLRDVARALGYRAAAWVPLLQDGDVIGAIGVTRREAIPFTAAQVALLQTFADQAVIAIENVRLFTELQEKNRALTEALDQQTATAEVLKAISRSTFELEPVLATVVENSTRLSGATNGMLYRFDGERLSLAATASGMRRELVEYAEQHPISPGRGTLIGRVALETKPVHIGDLSADPEYQWSEWLRLARIRTVLGVPMLREGTLLGALAFWRDEVRPFSETQIELVKTFADQAVIAIENVRLFSELQERTGALTRSVDQLTALGEISRAVSSTLDLDRVLNTVVLRASQLAAADGCSIFEYDETACGFRMRATSQVEPAQRAAIVPAGEGAVGRLTETRAPVQIPDISSEDAYRSPLRDALIAGGYRALLAVPMIQEAAVVGGLVVSRKMPGEFPAETVELLQTFANQSALAIANARLFREIEEKSAQLEVANQHKSEFLANMSHELRTPLNAVIGFSDVLLEGMFGEINEKQAEYLRDILSSGKHLLSLINDILDLSKIEAGRMELDLSDFDVPQAIADALLLMRERAQRHGVALGQVIDDRLGAVTADERKFKQVLLNLLSNAVKFTPAGGKVEVRARLVESMIEVAVADTGEGIAHEDQAAVFEEFRQVGKSAKKVEGTGLGLALCRKFVELHGGTIMVESQVGVGSTFTFTVPLRMTEAAKS